ncbi:MAG: hypothetical protein GY699_25110 [Desulfobacteraceae bacterium]|nr:hypothetical protein [Desulfobacteraceae bacterium]
MKSLNRILLLIFLISILVTFGNTPVFSSYGGGGVGVGGGDSPAALGIASGSGGPSVTTVASAVHAGSALSETFVKYNTIMEEYDKETDLAKKKRLLEKAKSIFSELINQANDIESEVSIASKKKLNDMYSKKLDRVLQAVLEMKKLASNDMNKVKENA